MSTSAERSRRPVAPAAIAAACCLALAPACKRPAVGEPTKGAQVVGGPAITITGATVDGTGRVIASLTITDGGVPVETREAALALKPMFTLAALSRHPVDGLAAWKSLLLTGAQTLAQLPPGGPGTPAGQVLTDVKQPGAESGGTFAGEDGAFTYTYAAALPAGFDPEETLRVGVWLLGDGTAEGTSTFDFRPAGGTPDPRDTVLAANCSRCHDAVVSPRGAVGVKMCITCHTWQNADPDTVDPAALDGATGATNPNPLDLGRMMHRIHRGKNLPTLYASSSTAPAPALPSATVPPLPFFPGRNTPVVGRKYSIVGPMSHEAVFGHVVSRSENHLAARTLATGVVFPRDLRDCTVCHGGAPQEYEVLYAISRRTCSGCHPDVWFAAPNGDGTTSITDAVHFAHAGGPRADDLECRGCHVAATASQPKVYAPIAEIHVPPQYGSRYARPVIEIVSVENLRAGQSPTVKYKLYDRVGTLSPPNAATPAIDPSPGGSPVPRTIALATGGWIGINVSGPTAPGYSSVLLSNLDPGSPDAFSLVADGNGVFTFTFASKLPADASGTWAVGMEARRRAATTLYDTASDEFRWPYTGESVSEPPRNALVYVDSATGTFTAGVADAAVPRRTIVAQRKCESCHDPIVIHGTVRNGVEYCLVCHSPSRTDWGVRPKLPSGDVNLAGTHDGIEERSIDFKVMIHRIHTGGRRGVASLEGIEPYVIYGKGGNPYFFDEGIFPGDLANCTLCHEGKSYTVEAVPADAPPTIANETGTILHAGSAAHVPGEPAVPAIQAACLGCHASGATQDHARGHTLAGVEQCAQCHVRGALSVEVAHGLARLGAAPVGSTYSSIAEKILVPRCASAACHGGSPPAAFPQLDSDAGYEAMVGVPSQQASGVDLVEPFDPGASYLLLKIRGEAGSVGGVATPMPIGDALLDPSDVAAIEAWIANGAPND